ncbi:gp58-like family protein [Streptococcus iners]
MLAKDRVFAIRAGAYTSSDIKEASFNYGYISGDTFKPGGTVAGSAKLIFTSIITTFNKLDKIYPEIGLLVGDSYEWVAMGEYFVNDISIDRNRNTTELDLMDGMFKLNQPYISDLTYPAQIRDVIREICVKTGIELETDNLGLKAIQRHIEAKADKKDITFREVLSQAIQLLGFSAFFNRKGKLEVRGLTESRITVTADNYFLHGLTKSEIQYQIAGITCKKDKETLTVGLRTGRSLELENSFMNQNLLDELYYELKDIKYYPFSLDWQGHLKLDVGQWVTLKTNKNETYKVLVLSQSFSFKGGLKSKISADSKAGNDTQYSYKGFLTKQIEQMSTQIDAEIQQQLEYANAEFDRKTEEYKKELDDGIEKSKAEAEAYADTIKQEIAGRVEELDRQFQANQQEQDRQIEESLRKAGASTDLANAAKTIAESAQANIEQTRAALTNLVNQSTTKVNQMEQSVDTLRTDVASQARTLLAQAQAQTDLSNRVTTVENMADGTRSTVSELSRTMNEATQNIASVTNRTRTVEDSLSQTRTQYENLTQTVNSQIGQIDSISRKTADLQSGIDGVTERFESLQVGGRNYFRGYEFNEEIALPAYQSVGSFIQFYNKLTYPLPEANEKTFTISFEAISPNGDTILQVYNTNGNPQYFYFNAYTIGTATNAWKKFKVTVNPTTRTTYISSTNSNKLEIYAPSKTGVKLRNIKVELGTVATDWTAAEEDLRSEIATYKRTAEESSAELSRQIQLVDGKAVEAKTYAQQTADTIKTRLESLETYKNEEGTRASQYLTASRTETAKQITAERTTISENYVAKSTFEENARGVTQRFDSLQSYADTKIAEYKNTVDGQFVNLQTQVNGKANQSDFQRVQTTSQLYERIIGSTEDMVKEKVARMVMADSLFQTEVGKVNSNAELLSRVVDGLSITTNPTFDSDTNGIIVYNNAGNGAVVVTKQSNVGSSQPNGKPHRLMITHTGAASPDLGGFYSVSWSYRANTEYAVDFVAMLPVGYRLDLASNYLGIGGEKKWLTPNIGTGKWERYVGYYKLGPNFGASPLAFIFVSGPQPSATRPLTWYVQSFDILDISNSGSQALATRMTQLAGSWAVQNLTSAGTMLNQFNLLADGTNRIDGRLTHITGQTLIDDAAITDAKIASLDAGKITSGYISAERLDAKSITAAKLKVDQAFFDALAANRLLVKDFFAKDAVVKSIQAVTLSATQIESGILKAFNERTTLDLLTGKLTFNDGSPSIEFNSDASAIRRVTNGQSQFIKFKSYLLGTQTTIGANRKANDESIGTADFTGIQIQSRAGGVLSLIDKVYVCADEFVVDGGGTQFDGFEFKNREAIFPQSSGMLNLGRLGNRWKNVYAFDYYVGQNAVSLKEFLDAVRACFQQIAYGGMTQTTYTLIQSKLSSTFNKIQ